MNYRTALSILLTAAVWHVAGSPAHADLVLFDNFDSSGATVGDDANDPTDIPWTPSGTNLSIGSSSYSGPRAMKDGHGSNTYRYSTGAIPALQSLTDPGDRLVLTVQLRTNNASGLNGQDKTDGYRLGLFAPDNKGYFLNIAGGDDASDLSWWKDTGSDANLAAASGNTVLGSYGTGAPTIDDNNYDKFRMTFLRTQDGMSLGAEYFDDQSTPPVAITAADTSGAVTSFDRVLSGLGDHPIDFWIDDVQLDFNPDYVTNGDFEQGDAGFNSNYTYQATGPGGGEYGIVDNPNDWFSAMGTFGDHTTGSGLMLVADGGPVTDNMVLEWTVPVVAGLPYNFVGYFAEAGGGTSTSQQLLEVRLDGVPLASLDLTGQSPGDWIEVAHQFVAPTTNPLGKLTIHALRTGGGGNNFAIDDVSFNLVPEPSTLLIWSLLAGLGIGLGWRRRTK